MRALSRHSCSRDRTSALGALGCLLVTASLLACSEPHATSVERGASTPLSRPDSVLLEGSVGELERLRDALPTNLGAALPESAIALLDGKCARLPSGLQQRVSPSARTSFVLIRHAGDADVGLALAVAVRTDDGATPLGADTAQGALDADGAPTGGRWVGGTPSEHRSALVLIHGVLVCAQDADDARTVAPYLARTLVPATRAAPQVATLRPAPLVMGAPFVADALVGTVGRDVHRGARAALAALAGSWSTSARRAIAAHSTPPVLGDPVALIDVLRVRLEQLNAFLPDLGAVHTTIAPGGGGVMVSMRANVLVGSRLDTTLDTLPTTELRTLGTLPRGTALAALFPAEPTSVRTEWSFGAGLADDLTRIAGAQLSAADAAKLRDAFTELGGARGTALVAAVGHGLAGPFALLGSGGATTAPALEKLTAALGTGYVRAATGLALGCSSEAAPHALSAPLTFDGATLRMFDVCDAHAPLATNLSTPRGPRFDHASRNGAWTLSITQLPIGPMGTPLSSIATRVAGALSGADDGFALAAEPDTARALASLPSRVYFAAAVIPEQLLAAASLLPIDVLVRAVSEASEPPPGPPLLLTLARDGPTLRLDLVLPRRALSQAVETYAAAASLFR